MGLDYTGIDRASRSLPVVGHNCRMPQVSQAGVWPDGRACAVSLTYDGALGEHLSLLPLLEALGLTASFFVSATRLLDNPQAWQKAAETHEIGNHSLFGVADGGTLLNWGFEMVEADILSTNRLISQTMGQVCHSFALPGWSTHCAEGDYLPIAQRMFPYVRSERREANAWNDCDLGYVGSFPIELPDVQKLIEQSQAKGSWIVLRGDRIRDDERHERLLKSIAAASESMWVAPFGAVAERLGSLRAHSL